jgi:hypothetical protein
MRSLGIQHPHTIADLILAELRLARHNNNKNNKQA